MLAALVEYGLLRKYQGFHKCYKINFYYCTAIPKLDSQDDIIAYPVFGKIPYLRLDYLRSFALQWTKYAL